MYDKKVTWELTQFLRWLLSARHNPYHRTIFSVLLGVITLTACYLRLVP